MVLDLRFKNGGGFEGIKEDNMVFFLIFSIKSMF